MPCTALHVCQTVKVPDGIAALWAGGEMLGKPCVARGASRVPGLELASLWKGGIEKRLRICKILYETNC